MEKDKNNAPEQSKSEHTKPTDPQENEKNGNVLGKAFDTMFGDSEGGNSLSEDESKEPGKQGSLKD